MATHSTTSHLSLIEAVEMLSNIADLEFDHEVGITQKHEIVLNNEKIAYRTVHWLHQQDASVTVNLVKDTFRVILHYLRQFYKKEYGYVTDPKTVEGIKTIMVLVGEAAKKLDKYTAIFQHNQQKSVTEFKEYRQLQEFYLSKIARQIDEGVLGKWILGLSLGQRLKQNATDESIEEQFKDVKHVSIDLETVKKDAEYELFFIRREDGSRFFSPRLLRNIKLICDFGSYFGERKDIDPLQLIDHWQDRQSHLCARDILKALDTEVENFYHQLPQLKNNEVAEKLAKALLALLLSSHTKNLLRHHPIKSCREYFEDFQLFLREVLHSKTYQKWLAYPPPPSRSLDLDLLHLIHHLCHTFYSQLQGMEEIIVTIQDLLREAHQGLSAEHLEEVTKSGQLWNQIANDYISLTKLMKRHPNGPLIKVVKMLDENAFYFFDPLLKHNTPHQLFDLQVQNRRISNIHLATPLLQEFISKAHVLEEFKGFLAFDSSHVKPNKHLLINLQDRTSWREYARCQALEQLQFQPDLKERICVVTLAIDTDFYNQIAPYHQLNHAKPFINQFRAQLTEEEFGFYFPPSIDRQELVEFIDRTLEKIHQVFFSSKNVLRREERLNFIEIFYLFLQLKLIDMVKPSSFSLTCKDGIDMGASYNTELFILLKLINQPRLEEKDKKYLDYLLYAPALLIRERILFPERFNRLVSVVRVIENVQHPSEKLFGEVIRDVFSPLFKTPILQSTLLLPPKAF